MYGNKKNLTALLIALSTYTLLPSGRDTNTCSNVVAGTNQNVRGQEANCTTGASEGGGIAESLLGVNAFKDKVSWRLKNPQKLDLGKITANKDFTLQYPTVGRMKQVIFTPTEGNAANKKVEMLLVSFSIYNMDKNLILPESSTVARENLNNQLMALKNAQSPFANLIKIYRKIGTERQWEERAELFTKSNPESKAMDTQWTIMPDGKVKADEKLFQTDVNGVTTEYPGEVFDLTAME